MNTRPLLLLTFVAAICCSLSTASAQSRGVGATIVTSAPVTLLPDAGRAPLATLAEGTQIQVLGPEEEGWYRIAFRDSYLWGDRIGYVRAEHVRVAAPLRVTPPALKTTPASPVRPPAVSSRLSESSIVTAIAAGRETTRRRPGLRLLDTGERWAELPTPGSTGPEERTRIRLELHTPLAWVQQLARDATRENRPFNLEDVTDAVTEPVLRMSAMGLGTSWVRHVVLRGESRDFVVQPLTKEACSEHVLNAMGGSTVFEGLRLTFSMDALRKLTGPRGDGDFFITVVGATGEEKHLKITKAHFPDLPM